MDTDFEVIVVGAGVIGSATAYHLSKELGSKVLLLEQYDFLHRRGSSHGDSRIIRYTYPQDYYTELMFDSYRLWAEAEAESSLSVFTETGGLDFGHKDNPTLQSLILAAQKFSVKHEVFSTQAALQERFPMVKLPPDNLAVYSPNSGILNATKSVAMFQQLARSRGATLLEKSPVTNITQEEEGKVVVEANGQRYRAKKCILAAGPWTNKILKKVSNFDLPLNPIQPTIAYWKVDQPEAYSSSKFPVFISYDSPMLYGTPAHEFPNLIKCAAHSGPNADPDQRTFDPGHEAILNEVSPWLLKFFTGVSPTPQMTESCMYTETPDNDYVIDEVPGLQNVIIGAGFSGHGFKFAPLVGKLLAKLATTGEFIYPQVREVFAIRRFAK